MGKPYSHSYHFAGGGCSTGRMICEKCNQPIFNHAHDWVSYQMDYRGPDGWMDWKYVTHHRACYPDQSGWTKLEKKARQEEDRVNSIMAALDKICSDFNASYVELTALMDEAPQ